MAFDPCQRAPHLRISELAGVGEEGKERFFNPAVVPMSPVGPAQRWFDFRRRCARRSIMIVAAALALFDSKARTGVWPDRRSRKSSLGSSIGADDPRATDDEEAFQ